MTENEALNELRLQSIVLERRVQANREIEEFVSSALLEQRKNAIDMAIQALKEVQQYRAIGTIEELRIAKRMYDKFYESARDAFKDSEDKEREFKEKIKKSLGGC